tara:strand:- start:102 stop:299 length:198 start_codon:yes stop_codon:yes gene_type:complete
MQRDGANHDGNESKLLPLRPRLSLPEPTSQMLVATKEPHQGDGYLLAEANLDSELDSSIFKPPRQ